MIAFSFGAGLVPVAPGTWGTLLAFPLFWLLQTRLEAAAFLAVVAILFGVGVTACPADAAVRSQLLRRTVVVGDSVHPLADGDYLLRLIAWPGTVNADTQSFTLTVRRRL